MKGKSSEMLLGLMMFFGVLASASSSYAIPTAGIYAFTSGPNGTFVSDGLQLTAWEIDDPATSTRHWSNTTLLPAGLQFVNINDTSTFKTNEFGHYFFTLDWANGTWIDTSTIPTEEILATGDFTYEARAGVPEPSSLGLLVSGLVGLAGYGWWQRQQAQA